MLRLKTDSLCLFSTCHGGTGVDRDYVLFRYCELARQIELTAGSSAR